MAEKPFKFTLNKLKKYPLPDEPIIVQDTANEYLFCRITPAGGRSLRVYKFAHGKPNRYPLKKFDAYKTDAAMRKDAGIEQQRIDDGLPPTYGRKQVKEKAIAKELGVVDASVWAEPSFHPTLGETLEYYLGVQELKESTKQGYRDKLVSANWNDEKFEDITPAMFETKYNDLKKLGGYVPVNFLKTFSILYNFANSKLLSNSGGKRALPDIPIEEHITKQSKKIIKTSKRKSFIKTPQLKEWWEQTLKLPDLTSSGADYRDYLHLTLLTGCRKGEALKLKWENVDFKNNEITFTDTKNSDDLTTPMTDFIRTMMQARFDNKPKKALKVFPFTDVRYGINKMRDAGFDFMPHDNRRTFITYCRRAGIDWLMMKCLMNHRKPEDVTADYTQVEYEDLLEAVNKLDAYVMGIVNAPDEE